MNNADRAFKRLMIRGAVQGIGYRVWVEREALALDLKGWVRNHRDGAVELVIAGTPGAVLAIVERCRKGPPLAKVESVDVEEASSLDLGHRRSGENFSLLPTV
jgi:acylphosphatase